jgi:putative ABC transport system permease protein
MLTNYFTIAWRSISRNKLYTAINILGLAMGTCACLVIFLLTRFEFSFDTFHPDKDRIYRVVGEAKRKSGEKIFLNSTIPDVAGIQTAIPDWEVTAGYHLYGANTTVPQGDQPDKKFNGRIGNSHVPASIITGPAYFAVFGYEWLYGNPAALNEPFKVVLSEKRARQYFGAGPLNKMIGKEVIYDDSLHVNVAGIVKDWNGNTDFGYTDFISISSATHSFLRAQIPTEDWSSLQPHGSHAFVKLAKGATAAQVNNKLAAFIRNHVQLKEPGAKLSLWLQPLGDIHFTSDFHPTDDGDDMRKAYLPTLYALMGLALFILVIAAVNFINLSTAQSIRRAKEVGIRKVMGGKRGNLVFQFLMETFILTSLAVVLSILLVKPVLAVFSSFIPEGVNFQFFNIPTLLFLISVTLITTLLAGFYPARVLSSYLPVLSLKGEAGQQGGKGWNMRKRLIVFQFIIALLFIIGALVMGDQIAFMHSADKGFTTDAILTINKWRDKNGQLRVLAGNVSHIAGVEQTILQGNAPMGFAHANGLLKYKADKDIDLHVSVESGDEHFIPFYQMKIIAGRNFLHSDSLNQLVINETATRALGFSKPEQALGRRLYQGDQPYPVVGVVADFYENSFRELIKPMVIENDARRQSSMAVKLATTGKQGTDAKAIIAQIGQQWKKIYPDEPFDYSFLNESIARLYEQETKTAWLMNTAMIITIFISCMGLFGLALFSAESRTKEIGIRKVLGASVTSIAALLSKDFIRLVLVAILIASPIAWYCMNQWLQDFVYRIHIGGWVFVLAGLGAILVALLTISFQAIRAAMSNPVKTLRTE